MVSSSLKNISTGNKNKIFLDMKSRYFFFKFNKNFLLETAGSGYLFFCIFQVNISFSID